MTIVVPDGVGCGEMPDASAFGDAGSDTLANLASATGGLRVPHLQSIGPGDIIAIPGISPSAFALACVGRMAERSSGRNSTIGHWEITGIVTEQLFSVFPRGVPPESIARLEAETGRRTIGNVSA